MTQAASEPATYWLRRSIVTLLRQGASLEECARHHRTRRPWLTKRDVDLLLWRGLGS